MKIRFEGEEFSLLGEGQLTWAEADAIERATGRTFARDAGAVALTGGLVWASVKRGRPDLSYREFVARPTGDFEEVEEETAAAGEDGTEAEPDPLEEFPSPNGLLPERV